MSGIRKYRYLIARRLVQTGVLLLFMAANYLGWSVLKGNYSAGLVLNTIPLADPYAVLQILCSGFIAGTDLLLGAILVLVLYGLLLGRVFCSWICPVNLLADGALFASKKLKMGHSLTFSRNTRYGALVLGLLLSSLLGFSAFEALSPIAIVHRGLIFGMGSAWALIAALFLFDWVILKNGWCGHLCPLGAFYALTARFSLLKVQHSNDNCTQCNKCFPVCHEPQVLGIVGKQNGIIQSGECTNCARCIEVCDDKALYFTFTNRIKNKKL